LKRHVFIASDTEWPDTFEDAEGFSSSHTLRLGTRAFDISACGRSLPSDDETLHHL